MKRLKSILFLILLGCLSLSAQIVHQKGNPKSWGVKKVLEPVARFQLPQFDNLKLIEKYEVLALNKRGPFKFAEPVKTELHTANSGTWSNLENGDRIWRIRLESPGANSLNIIFDEFRLQPGEQVFIYSADHSQVRGPFTDQNNKPWGSLSTVPVFSDNIMVEYYVPVRNTKQGNLSIGQVAHGFRKFGDSGACNNNVICEKWTDWTCQSHSVVLLFEGGDGFCSGTLLNNVKEDGRPIISTANHCLESNVNNWTFIFNWISPSCDPTENTLMNQSVSGGTELVSDGGSDFALLEMSQKPPAIYDAYYSGWDATGDIPDFVVGIHHPSGDIMKITKDDDSPQKYGSYWGVDWDDGTTEPGSSGSVLYNDKHQLIGQLEGGNASCDNQRGGDSYGGLFASWKNGAQEVLDPDNTGTKSIDGMGTTGECGEGETAVDYSVPADKKGLKLQVTTLKTGKGFIINALSDVKLELQSVDGKTLLVRNLKTGSNTIEYPQGLNGTYVLRFPESSFAPQKIMINTP